ncbi:conserved hypothetical protein [Thiomonas arsenitoxydans]|uniref:Uncharacterized protein n=1 Tax=Thiomonas arsenitoxydans (strain DSM 22701 / CIP 110005 / 3As) TaxID=426114 RepID=D6CLC5_THIA3|nr:hypothetical protein [Thiomonas arsenitoxydans]CAZ89353.1 hypothetical protein THI_2740 [Thiomonas arsenitoxydans]CQR33875.1 conserved hypothetical protein [Thiomonas arsenitoxydans]CQR35547.1 conserved hypothetical protein [Thiomonas arsenitoxydans]CQR37779.1 conserved hypothetical protein [Thiomonas arsenitoxydans]CQR37921.1 conserved hypothetical protein [Thiomonas arsenitoxydans]
MSAKRKTPAISASTCEVLDPIPRQKVRLHTVDDLRLEMGRVYNDMRAGRLESGEGTKLAYVLGQMVRVFELAVIEKRIDALEMTHEQKP